MTQPNSTYSKEEISFKKIWSYGQSLSKLILAKKNVILFSVFLLSTIGYFSSYFMPKSYVAKLSFVLADNSKNKLSDYSSLAAQFGLSMGNSGGAFLQDENILALMQSRSIISRTLLSPTNDNEELLIDTYLKTINWDKNSSIKKLKFQDNNNDQQRFKDSVLGVVYQLILKKNLKVSKPEAQADILLITTKSTNELFSQNFTEQLLRNVSQFYIETQTKKAQENVNILRHQVDSVKGLLHAAISGVATSTDANPNMNPAMRQLLVPAQRKMVDVEMNKVLLQELVKNLEIASIGLRKETPLVQIIDRPILPLEIVGLSKIKGLVLGALLGFIAPIFFLLCKSYFRKLIQ